MAFKTCYWLGIVNSNKLQPTFFDREQISQVVGSDPLEMLRLTLEKTKHTYMFILTQAQWAQWEVANKKWKYDEFLEFMMPNFVTNPVHNVERNLRVIILKGKGDLE